MTGDASERLADALALVAHDLGEPLREVTGFAELLERRAEERLTPEDEELLVHVLVGARRMEAMLAGLAAYIRAERLPLRPQPVEVAELVDDRVELGEAVPLHGDPALLGDLVARLVDNARKFGGEEVRIVVASRREDDRAVLEVADDGPGVPAGDEERVLRLFQRTHPRDEFAGAGVGLTIAAAIAARHGGALQIVRREGGGTVVRATLPAA